MLCGLMRLSYIMLKYCFQDHDRVNVKQIILYSYTNILCNILYIIHLDLKSKLQSDYKLNISCLIKI